MTTLGKLLVFINLALSLLMATWAHSIFTNRMDWTTNKGKDGAPDGALVRRIARIKDLQEALKPAAVSWNNDRATIASLDERRVKNRLWYESELTLLRTGADKTNPARAVKLEKGQPIQIDPGKDDRPVMQEGRDPYHQPLLSLVAYDQTETSLNQAINQKNDELTKIVKEDHELTNKLAGDPDPSKHAKGLQQRILEEQAKLRELVNELEFVRPLLVNAVVNSDLVYKRNKTLEARLKELQKVGMTNRNGESRGN